VWLAKVWSTKFCRAESSHAPAVAKPSSSLGGPVRAQSGIDVDLEVRGLALEVGGRDQLGWIRNLGGDAVEAGAIEDVRHSSLSYLFICEAEQALAAAQALELAFFRDIYPIYRPAARA
jgi:hypothetical protein